MKTKEAAARGKARAKREKAHKESRTKKQARAVEKDNKEKREESSRRAANKELKDKDRAKARVLKKETDTTSGGETGKAQVR